MPVSFTITTTRANTDAPWLVTSNSESQYFSTEEFNQNIKPYWDWIEGSTGYISTEFNIVDGLTKQVVINFDTYGNAKKVQKQMIVPDMNDVVKAKNTSMKNKMIQLGIDGQYKGSISDVSL